MDWAAVRAYYQVGHTRTDCQQRFGFSNGAWQRAVDRGEIVPRPRSTRVRASERRAMVGRPNYGGRNGHRRKEREAKAA